MRLNPATAIVLIANLLVAALIPVATNAISPTLFSAGENILFGLLTLIAVSLLEIFLMTKAVFDFEKREVEFWAAKSATDADLLALRVTFHEISRNTDPAKNLFASHVSRQIAEVRRGADEAHYKKEIVLSKRHVDTTDALLLGFQGDADDIFRATNNLGEIETFFDVTYRQYLYDFDGKVRAGKITEVRRLFLYSDIVQLKAPRALRLLAFHAHRPHMAGRVIPIKAFRRLLKDYAPPGMCEDFGIFAERYVYRAIAHGLDEITGSFSADEHVIGGYTAFFEAAWRSPIGIDVNELIGAGIELPALFEEKAVTLTDHKLWAAELADQTVQGVADA
ncbi:MAG TPA: hypothetical protein VF702_07285 [Allosphingosinicella sp.]|jgi:hypothetical protein